MVATNNGWPIVAEAAVTRVYLAEDGNGAQALKGDVATALSWLVEQIDTRVEPVTMVNGWRSAESNKAAGGARGSNHMSGTAFDINGHLHWYEAKLPESAKYSNYRSGWTAAEIAEIRAILREAGGLFAWGLDYNPGWRDAMHFDITKGRTAKDVARFVASIRPTQEDDMPTADEIARAVWNFKRPGTDTADLDAHKILRRINGNAEAAVTILRNPDVLIDALVKEMPTGVGGLTESEVRRAARKAITDVLTNGTGGK